MTPAQRKIWSFACTNADFWPILKAGDGVPPEVARLGPDEREAFEAARDEVQTRYSALLRTCWNELLARWGADGRKPWFNNRRNKETLLSADLQNGLPNNKGNVHIVVGPWDVEANRLGVWAKVWVANKRVPQARLVFDDFGQDGNYFYIGLALDPAYTDEEVARLLHDAYFAKLTAWVDTPDDASQPADEESEA